jgi:hypothetical protein
MSSTRKRPNAPAVGKVARLPYEVREELCRRMRDGQQYRDLADWLVGAAPGASISAQNLSNWKHGGYKEWESKQAHLDAIRRRAEDVRRELEAGGFSVLDKAIYELADKLSDTDMDAGKAAAAIAALKNAVTQGERSRVDALRASIAQEQAKLSRDKFRRETCELFLRWYSDARAREIADSPASNEEKIKAIHGLYFADVNALERSGEVQIPA